MALELRVAKACEDDALEAIRTLLTYLGEEPDREGLSGTPARILKSWSELFAGYRQSPESLLSTTFDEVEGYREIVLLRDIPFHSTCEHHWLPFEGVAHVAYLPGQRVVGLSKLARLVDCFARRLQIQERMTQQVMQALMTHLSARGAAVMIEARHSCMSCRGIRKEGAMMVTTAYAGEFLQPERRTEFLALIKA
ncbi:MAG TPA: GTP cyclohydrolase I FolE [Stenomitos sp.]